MWRLIIQKAMFDITLIFFADMAKLFEETDKKMACMYIYRVIHDIKKEFLEGA